MTTWTDNETGGTVWSDQEGSEVNVSAFMQTLLNDASATEARATLAAAGTAELAASPGASLVGCLPSGTGATSRDLQTKVREIERSVKDYGAVGDGATDDTAAITAAYTATPTGGKLVFPVATSGYLISSKLTIAKHIQLVFEGSRAVANNEFPGSYLLKKSTMAANGVEITANGVTWQGGGVVGAVGNTGDGIVILANNVTLDQVCGINCGNDGIRIGRDATGGNSNSFYIVKPVCSGNGRHGIYINDDTTDAATNANAGTIIEPFTQSNTLDGIKNDRGYANTIIGLLSESNSGYGVRITAKARNALILGGDSEANTTGDVIVEASATDTRVIGLTYGSLTDNATTTTVLSPTINQFPVQVKATASAGGLGAAFFARAASAAYAWYATGGAVDAKGWYIIASGSTIVMNTVNDANSVANPIWTMSRSGATPTNMSMSTRFNCAQGANVTAANNLALGTDGNYFQVDGATQINLLTFAGWQGGSVVTLKFNSTPTVKHNQAASGNFKPIRLSGAADFVASASDTLTICYDATDAAWYEIGRAVI